MLGLVPRAGGYGAIKGERLGIVQLGVLDAETARLEFGEHHLDVPALRIVQGGEGTVTLFGWSRAEAYRSDDDSDGYV